MSALKRLQILLLAVWFARGGASAQSASAVFIQRDSTADGRYQAIYIDTASAAYEGIALSEEGIRSFSENLAAEHPGVVLKSRRMPAGLPRNWVPLHFYKGQYYVYHPCDGIFLSAAALTDSTIVHCQYNLYDSKADVLTRTEKRSSNRFDLFYGQPSDSGRLTIILIDAQRHIAVFRYSCRGGVCDDYLMVDAAMIRRFPVIVNDCRTDKAMEFEFEPIDFNSLLK